VLEDRLVVPIGGEPQAVNVRIISATHRNLQERVADGSFREDLYYRLNGLEIALPPLRERTDKSQLLDFLLAQEAGADGRARSALRRVRRCWTSRGRATCANCARCCVPWRRCARAHVIRLRTLPAINSPGACPRRPSRREHPLEDAEKQACIAGMLELHRWHMTHTAAATGREPQYAVQKAAQAWDCVAFCGLSEGKDRSCALTPVLINSPS
jgi:sigma-54 dependent transcriptional regulator, acetoin dehydrogenase operon transcriptional activator AcoR